MTQKTRRFLAVGLILTLVMLVLTLGSAAAQPAMAPEAVPITILHTNDFHANLKPDSSNRGGSAYIAGYVNQVKTEVGAENVVLLDAGDIMFGGTPFGPLTEGEAVIDIYNRLGYAVSAIGNHEWDKGQALLQTRIAQANFPFVAANVVLQGTNTPPAYLKPYVVLNVGGIRLGVIGLTTTETPNITVAGLTAGLEFKDPGETVLRYYDEVKAASDAVILLTHQGVDNPTYKGDKQIAQDLLAAGKPVDLIIGGHSHTNLNNKPVLVGNGVYTTTIVQAYYAGRQVGRVDAMVDPTTKKLTVTRWEGHAILSTAITPDPDIAARVQFWDAQIAPLLNQPVGVSNVELIRNYNAESNIGDMVADSMRWKADAIDDGQLNNSVVAAFTNSGGLRSDITIPAGGSLPINVTWGATFSVLPFNNTLYLMDLTGAQLKSLLDQSARLEKGLLQSSGVKYYWWNDCGCNTPKNWGAYGIEVGGQPLDYKKTYRIVTNNFLAPGGDSFATFTQGTNRRDTGFDMQEGFNDWIKANTPIHNPADFGQRAIKLSQIVTILHTNDTHGRWEADRFHGGFAYLATLIKQERAKNPHALLLDAGDTTQGNAFAFFYKDRDPNPIIRGLNLLKYDALTLGNHDFNFGKDTFARTWAQAEFPILGANVRDDGRYGFKPGQIKDYIVKTVDGIKVAILGLTNPRVPFYEMPTNIEGLTFSNGFETAQRLVPEIRSTEHPALLVTLSHMGYSPYEGGDERSTDKYLAQNLAGIDVIVGGHSHTRLDYGDMTTSAINPQGTLIAQAYRYAGYLGKVTVGFTGDATTGYTMVSRDAELLSTSTAAVDPDMQTFLAPFVTEINAYTSQVIGTSSTPLDATQAYTQETGAANLQVDATRWQAEQLGYNVDFHLSGAMTNAQVPAGTLKVGDMFTLMPYENALVIYRLNGPQIKTILEKSYWNWWQYYYNTGRGSRYTTCFLDISRGGQIVYDKSRPPDGNNVVALRLNGRFVDLTDANTFYTVSTVNYIGAGSCNFKDPTQTYSLWPIDQLIASPQIYVRESVIEWIRLNSPISPQVENRLVLANPQTVSITPAANRMGYVDSLNRLGKYLGTGMMWTGQDTRPQTHRYLHGIFQLDLGALPADAVIGSAELSLSQRNTHYATGNSTYSLNLLPETVDSTFNRTSYWVIHNTPPEATLNLGLVTPAEGAIRNASFGTGALQSLQDRLLTTRLATFRLDGKLMLPYGRDVLGWDGRAGSGAPVLDVTYYVP